MAETYDWINESYNLNVVPGCRVRMEDKMGTILLPRPGSGQYVNVLFDGEFRESLCHPTWEMTYFGFAAPSAQETTPVSEPNVLAESQKTEVN